MIKNFKYRHNTDLWTSGKNSREKVPWKIAAQRNAPGKLPPVHSTSWKYFLLMNENLTDQF